MTDKTELEIQRGERASLLLKDELIVEVLDKIEREYTETWKNSPVRDQQGALMLLLMVKSAQKFRMELESVVETGQFASARLAEQSLAQQVGQMLNPSF